MQDKYPKFLPQWTESVEYSLNNNAHNDIEVIKISISKFGLDWYEETCCLTGEAFFHKAAPTDQCQKCKELTYNSHLSFLSLDLFYRFKIDLVKHLKIAHPSTWAQWKDRL